MEDRFAEQAESDLTCLVDEKNGDRMIKQLLNLVIAKYRDLSLSRRSVSCNYIARNSEPLPLAKRDETLPCALFLFIGKCMEMIV